MKIHEYQSRRLLADAGVPVPPAEVVETAAQAVAAHEKIGGRVVVKAQVFAGGRGKAGFVKLCDTPEQTRQIQDLARRVHDTLRLRAYSRTDFILGPDGPIILEVNTLPGMTETSLIPQQAAVLGLSYRDLVTAILKASWDKD